MTSTSTASNGWKPGATSSRPAGAQDDARRGVAIGAVAGGRAAERDREARPVARLRAVALVGLLDLRASQRRRARARRRARRRSRRPRAAPRRSSITRSVVNQPKRSARSTASACGTPCSSAALTRRQARRGAERPRARAGGHRHAAPAEAPPRERGALRRCSRAPRTPRATPRGRSSRCERSTGRRSAPRARAARARSCRPTDRRRRCSATTSTRPG